MTADVPAKLENRIGRWERTLEEAREAISGEETSGRGVRKVAVDTRYVRILSRFLDETDQLTPSLQTGIERVLSEHESFVEEYGAVYFDVIESELRDIVERYPTKVCYAFELEPHHLEIPNTILSREVIELLLEEIGGRRDLDSVHTRIEALDEVFKCKVYRERDLVREHGHEFARPHFPERYWWRHPEDVIAEMK